MSEIDPFRDFAYDGLLHDLRAHSLFLFWRASIKDDAERCACSCYHPLFLRLQLPFAVVI